MKGNLGAHRNLDRPISLLEHLSREPGLTAGLPDVFEAKLVFSDQRVNLDFRRGKGRLFLMLKICSTLSDHESNQVS